MKYNNIAKLAALPAALTLASSPLQAQQVNTDLTTAASKVDLTGSYLELNRLDGDVEFFTPYIQLVADVARKNGEQIPENFNAAKLINALGLNTLKASAMSNTKLGDLWHNQFYIQADPSAGIFSLTGGQAADFAAPTMSPAGTDVALELDLDLKKAPAIIKAIAASLGVDESELDFGEKIPELDMTIEEILNKSDVKLSLAIDFDEKNKLQIDEETMIVRPHLIARIDGATWIWDKIGDELIKEKKLPLGKSEKDGVITYTIPVEMEEMLQGYRPQIIVDKNKDQLWLVTSPELFTKANTAGAQLADDPKFQATWKGLPEKGNSMAYFSKDFFNSLEDLYATALKQGILDNEDFQKAKPLVDKLIEDITKSDSGFAFSIAGDTDGIHLSNKIPFPAKYGRYLQSLAHMIESKHDTERKVEIRRAQDAAE